MIVTTIPVYESFDGKKFTTKDDCIKYDTTLLETILNDMREWVHFVIPDQGHRPGSVIQASMGDAQMTKAHWEAVNELIRISEASCTNGMFKTYYVNAWPNDPITAERLQWTTLFLYQTENVPPELLNHLSVKVHDFIRYACIDITKANISLSFPGYMGDPLITDGMWNAVQMAYRNGTPVLRVVAGLENLIGFAQSAADSVTVALEKLNQDISQIISHGEFPPADKKSDNVL